MLVDASNRFLTQREHPAMALLQVEINDTGLKIYLKENKKVFVHLPFVPESHETVNVQIFDETCAATFVSQQVDKWFTKALGAACRVVYMPDSSLRLVDEKYAFNKDITSFSDGFPYLIIGQASLDDLNIRLLNPLPVNRFRPNIVFTGGLPFQEDCMNHFTINNIDFYGVKPCARCVITTIDQENAHKGKEPLKTLATYRSGNNKIYFGQNLLVKGEGEIKVGDLINICT